ncbi:MAG: hypothetical protein KatS3mg060_0867 [Dehalococcoidia bacterium]|nr:MAG: hypothetical protein KatS3mg060_0867 [Dehalococcoidia bacterium]
MGTDMRRDIFDEQDRAIRAAMDAVAEEFHRPVGSIQRVLEGKSRERAFDNSATPIHDLRRLGFAEELTNRAAVQRCGLADQVDSEPVGGAVNINDSELRVEGEHGMIDGVEDVLYGRPDRRCRRCVNRHPTSRRQGGGAARRVTKRWAPGRASARQGRGPGHLRGWRAARRLRSSRGSSEPARACRELLGARAAPVRRVGRPH